LQFWVFNQKLWTIIEKCEITITTRGDPLAQGWYEIPKLSKGIGWSSNLVEDHKLSPKNKSIRLKLGWRSRILDKNNKLAHNLNEDYKLS